MPPVSMQIRSIRLTPLSLLLFALSWTAFSGSVTASPRRRILILAPHEDDETLGCAGVIEAAVRRGDEVRIVVATNGDFTGRRAAGIRLQETLHASEILGLSPVQVLFLGYGDGTLAHLYYAASDTAVISSHVGTQTYGDPPRVVDYHYSRYGEHAFYTRAGFRSDLTDIIAAFKPQDIYVTGLYDAHPDHAALFQFTIDTVTSLRRHDPRYTPIIHQYFIHASDDDRLWPRRDPQQVSLPSYRAPDWFERTTAWNWADREVVPVPPDMRIRAGHNRKHDAISMYPSQDPDTDHGFLYSFVKAEEFFFPIDMANIAPLATITASSDDPSHGEEASRVADGKIDGAPRFPNQEWVTRGEGKGAWIQLSWDAPQTIGRIVLYDRPNLSDQVLAGVLTFSDGGSLAIGALPNDGRAYALNFPTHTVTWIRMQITRAAGNHIGLSEFQVFHPRSHRHQIATLQQ